MASASTLTTFDAMMKELYEGTDPQDLAAKDHTFYSHVKKKGGFVGDVLPTPVAYGHPQGRSRVFSTAQTNANGSKTARFMLTRVKDYGVVTIDSELMLASKGGPGGLGAFVEARKFEVDQMLAEVGDNISRSIIRDQKGLIGVVGAVSSGVITLTDLNDARHYSKDMRIGAVLTPYGTPTQRSGVGTVSAVNRSEGKVTYTGTITSIAAGDYLFAEGDYSSSDASRSISGLAAWLPLTAPTSGDNFFGVDRSVDVTRLAGQRLNTPNAPIVENITLLAEMAAAERGRPERAYINHKKYTQLIWELGSKVEYTSGDNVKALFRGVKVPYSKGWIEVYGDADVPTTLGYVLDMDVCELRYLGPGIPHLVDDDGNMAVRSPADDGIEVRGRMYGNFRILAPARCGVFALSND